MIRPTRRTVFTAALVLLFAATGARADDEMIWRAVDAGNVAVMDLAEGRVVIELNPAFAPRTVEQFRQLVQGRFYDGLSFYRVIDGFVAQGGDGSDLGEISQVPTLQAEFEREWADELAFTPAQKPDLFAAETGFVDGFAAARDAAGSGGESQGKVWLVHCPGVVAMARQEDPDSSRTDFYIVIGQAPRYLDRNLTIFGRVIEGMDAVQRIRRGPAGDNGIIAADEGRSRIRSVRMLDETPAEERLRYYVMDTASKPFSRLLEERRDRTQDFFHHKPPRVLDVCQVPVGTRSTK